jgi:hypothetical protein
VKKTRAPRAPHDKFAPYYTPNTELPSKLTQARADMREEFTLAQTLRIDRLIQAHVARALSGKGES